jgi:transcriptional regulator with GAF, ATPase, and Fis domain
MAHSRHEEIDILHEISSRMASADEFHAVLERIVDFVSSVMRCDSCFIYTLEANKLVLRASKNPHAEIVDRLGISLGQGITGWVAEHLKPVAISAKAHQDSRFQLFQSLPEDSFEAFLSVPILCGGKSIGVINILISTLIAKCGFFPRLAFLVGSEVERARLESEVLDLSAQLETKKLVDRAKRILQQSLNISEEAAYLLLQQESRKRRRSMRHIAEALVLSNELTQKDTCIE